MRNSITFFGIFGLVFTSVSCVSYDEDVSLSASQASAFQQFKAHVIPKLKRDFEKEDLYLLQFLRAKKFDVDEAERFILRESKWRTEQGFDGIHNEDWSDMECCYPVFLEGVDREGKPLLIFDIGEWDIRAAVVAGKADRMAKWMSKNYDLARMRTRELGKEGKNVTRFSLIYDMKGFSATSISAASKATVPTTLPPVLRDGCNCAGPTFSEHV
ncbi:phosphatidylinositol/phosphatidylcholine transfer protein SFH2 isoform X2 [Folsomia candida]|uniref:phosphatidylinositol/phosphatidylcholine transfer protein SFH2 isoform X2 n=1 Tax=Folsomia candida TaxID=158441 RepID=UPI000B8FD60B|nr:phosphatidylinositol/phosphatidylcholine transfer protein SFH2 isoform X2 [Folsomia candida]